MGTGGGDVCGEGKGEGEIENGGGYCVEKEQVQHQGLDLQHPLGD